MKYSHYFMAVFAMSIILIACNRNPSNMKVQNVELQNISADTTIPGNNSIQENTNNQFKAEDKNYKKQSTSNNAVTSKNNNSDWDKKIIKTANIQLQLNNYKNFSATIHSSLKNFGAYIADEKQIENNFQIENAVTIKVPVDQFDNLINFFAGNGIKVTEKNISSEDVTGEVVNTKARMQAKMAVRDKYLQLLKQAKNMDEILRVQNEMNNIQEDIEAANGRINYLQHSSAYSTINLNYFQYLNGTTANDEKPDFFTKLLKAFSTGTSVITNLILFCISIWPLILIGLIGWLYLKKLKLKRIVKA